MGVAAVMTCGALASAWTRPVPDAALTLLGGPTGLERWGGLRVHYRPPGAAPLTLEFSGMRQAEADEQLATLVGGLTMHEARESDTFARAAALVELEAAADAAVRLEEDIWTPEGGRGERRRVAYLDAPSPDAIARVLEAAAAAGWQLPPGSQLGIERYHLRTGAPRWRTYELAAEPVITSLDLEEAITSYDPNTNVPLVLLTFTAPGAARFCEVTARLAGKKLATTLGGRVRSAPILNGAICGGRASITMGASEDRERQAQALAEVLNSRVPPGGEVLEAALLPPAAADWRHTAARLLMGVLVGLGAGAATALMLWFVRPSWRAPMWSSSGPWPWRRLGITLAAPALLVLGGWLTLPGVDRELLRDLTGGLNLASVTMLDVRPVLSAFALVELAALAVPWWRWRRYDTRGRAGLGRAVVVVATALALLQGYFVARYLESLDVADPGWAFRTTAMVTLATAPLLLAVVASFISERGLGNGYGALLGGGVVIELGRAVVGGPERAGWRPSESGLMALLALAAIAALTACVLRWRVGGDDRRLAYTSPASGNLPLSSVPGGLALLALLATVGLGRPLHIDQMMDWVGAQLARPAMTLSAAAILALLWAWLLARPALVAPRALQAGLGAPSWRDWRRAAVLSTYFAVAVSALYVVADAPAALLDGLAAVAFAAVVMDVVGDARAYRGGAVPAGALHQAQHAALAEHVLARAGIACHLHASHLRALGAFFMPYAPIVALVPPQRADEARALLEEALRPPTAALPPARVMTPDEPRTEVEAS